ncbi:enoyl-CoA hydratase/isomerase family protein [Acrocarpospora catenulata]|uniref:enoyl-CoA hydratase/isomerase family protein n=1 Tax=Acrocarpospora catenulata TaxID=2836182 RepID=UPI001BD96F73|nr:enoyl-CoA hydratase/isomerase family protein [Acrocarpospora catenulata]
MPIFLEHLTNVRVTVEEGVAIVTINRPEAGNSISQGLDADFGEVWPALRDSPDVEVVVVTGAGDRFFCTGADVNEWAETGQMPMSHTTGGHGFRLLANDQAFFKPLICAVNGLCAGGGLHFVNDADIVIASSTAAFTDPHVSVGQVSAHEPIALSRRIPLGEVMRMTLMGVHTRMSADRAYQIGLVSEVVEPDQLLERAVEIAKSIQRNSPTAVSKSKRAVLEGLERGLDDALWWGFGIVRSNWDHPDCSEGPRAYLERRQPVWQALGETGTRGK